MESSNDTDTGDTQTMSAQSTITNIPPRIALVCHQNVLPSNSFDSRKSN